ncbi:hypothetical protein Q4610_00175 [Sphingobium sp. HBC34]|uniref:Transposase n=1 Tax=Sphingobium cyanobacteriorum TaxID=3063954 RepID=A0ABT8ZHF5_9SPHN|nr:hypothetical protein [Sphingobium sp. HBC34]MDO7833454.1 hypothetical protein [Sphingobium sp. HBC34]
MIRRHAVGWLAVRNYHAVATPGTARTMSWKLRDNGVEIIRQLALDRPEQHRRGAKLSSM